MEKEGRELLKCVDVNSYEKGKYVVCSWAVRAQLPEYSQITKMKEVAQTYEIIGMQGFKGMITRTSNIKIVRTVEPMGGQVLK